MDRRQFLDTSARAAGALCGGLALASYATDSPGQEASNSIPTLPAIGLQLYTIRSVMEQDFRGAMDKVAETGYDEVEFAGYYDRRPEEIRALLDELGLVSPATHVPLGRLRKGLDEVIRTAKAIGHEYVVCPYLSEEQRTSIGDYRQLAEEFQAIGEECTAAGLQFAYHNHDFEFVEMDGTLPYEVLLSETTPKHVQMELDLYWVVEAGHDPIEYLKRDPDRFPLCHVKDRGRDGGIRSVGEGTIDFVPIFRQGNFDHYFVEHDNPEAPMKSIATSYRTLSDLEF